MMMPSAGTLPQCWQPMVGTRTIPEVFHDKTVVANHRSAGSFRGCEALTPFNGF